MSLKPTLPTETQTLFLNAALHGLIGSCTESLGKLKKAEALDILDRIADGDASFVWTIEASGTQATVKCEIGTTAGRSLALSLHTVSLEMNGGVLQ